MFSVGMENDVELHFHAGPAMDQGPRTGAGRTSRPLESVLLEDADYTYTYDKEGNLIERTSKANPILKTEYTYDYRNRLVKVENYNRNPSLTTPPQVSRSLDYAYDASNQLVSRQVQNFWIYVGRWRPVTMTRTSSITSTTAWIGRWRSTMTVTWPAVTY